MPKRVLILCTGNSCRSQMAEALWRNSAGETWEVHSAGTEPQGLVHPMARRALEELGLVVEGARSKDLEEFRGRLFDVVITVCDAAHEACPAFPGTSRQLHWPFEDPAQATGSEGERMAVFRRVRDEIASKIRDYLDDSP